MMTFRSKSQAVCMVPGFTFGPKTLTVPRQAYRRNLHARAQISRQGQRSARPDPQRAPGRGRLPSEQERHAIKLCQGVIASFLPFLVAFPASASEQQDNLQAALPWVIITLGACLWSLVLPPPRMNTVRRDNQRSKEEPIREVAAAQEENLSEKVPDLPGTALGYMEEWSGPNADEKGRGANTIVADSAATASVASAEPTPEVARETPELTGQDLALTGQTLDLVGQTSEQAGQTPEQAGQSLALTGQTLDLAGQTPKQAGQTTEQAGQSLALLADSSSATEASAGVGAGIAVIPPQQDISVVEFGNESPQSASQAQSLSQGEAIARSAAVYSKDSNSLLSEAHSASQDEAVARLSAVHSKDSSSLMSQTLPEAAESLVDGSSEKHLEANIPDLSVLETAASTQEGAERSITQPESRVMQKSYEARVTPLRRVAAERGVQGSRLWEANRSKAQQIFSSASAKEESGNGQATSNSLVKLTTPARHLATWLPKAIVMPLLRQAVLFWNWMRQTIRALFSRRHGHDAAMS